MEVIKARNLGFCNGVKLALTVVRDAIKEARELGVPCYIYGDIVHNSYVMERITHEGVKIVDSPNECDEKGILIIRTHGISDTLRDEFIKKGPIIRDATCPVVLRNQSLVRNSEKPVVIFGLAGHSEVISLVGASKIAYPNPLIIDSDSKLSLLDKKHEYTAVVQTTFSTTLFKEIKKKIAEDGIAVDFLNDICMSSQLRRNGIKELKGKVDAIIVVGDKHSANTNELVSIAREIGMIAFLVEKADNITSEMTRYDRIGLTAGASTPDYIYNEVEAYLRSIDDGR